MRSHADSPQRRDAREPALDPNRAGAAPARSRRMPAASHPRRAAAAWAWAWAWAMLCFGGHAQADQRAPLDCGSASNGLAIVASSDRRHELACPMAVAVAEAYLRVSQAGRRGPFRIRIAGATWACAEVRGETNPYGECTMRRNRRERVQLRS